MAFALKIIPDNLFLNYKDLLDVDIARNFETIQNQELEPHSFTFLYFCVGNDFLKN